VANTDQTSGAATDQTSGAATGAAIGSIIPGVGTAIGSVIGTILSFLPGLKGKTQHLSWNEANTVTRPLADKLADAINSQASARVLNDLSGFPSAAADAIDGCNWWKVGNDQEAVVPSDIRKNPTTDGTIWRVFMWGFQNAPTGKYADTYAAVTEIFNNSLYPILNEDNPELTQVIDLALAGATSQKSGSAKSSTSTSSSSGSSIIDTIKNALGISSGTTSTTSSSAKQAGLNPIVIFLIIGAALSVVVLLIKKGRAS
jgi:hypothetical protein